MAHFRNKYSLVDCNCRQMFPHMVERAIIPHTQGTEDLKDNVSIINATDMKPLVSLAESVTVIIL